MPTNKQIGEQFERIISQTLENYKQEGLILDYLKLAPEVFCTTGFKYYAHMYNGYADFLIFLKMGKVIFIEAKATNKASEKNNQKEKRLKFQECGYSWYVLKNSIKDLENIIYKEIAKDS